ncbi:hypothetical protein [Paraburkholderia sp. J63]|uniref:hypothetical protein n=1 Tax=Paraburkholderia sp. J63 TaxID=2805434 RepID=UPI002ABE487E|nr:hypothetical protein [Paraburkholderia sp. J63]
MAEHADNGPSNIGRTARSASSRRRNPTPSPDTEVTLSADAPAAEPGSALTLDLFDAGAEPGGEHEAAEVADAAQAAGAKGGRATTARRAARTPVTAEPMEDAASTDGEPDGQAAGGVHGDAPQALAVTEGEGAERAASSSESVTAPGGLHGAAKEPVLSGLPPANGFSYAATGATGNAARMVSTVHAADVDAAVHGQVPERAASHDAGRAVAMLPTEIVAAMAAQTRRTKWMLTAAVAALVVTAGVAIAQTLLLASLSADTATQQQRFDVLMQNQQVALDNMGARLAAPAATLAAAAPPPPPATPPRHAARAATMPKTSEKATSRAAAHLRHARSSRQAAAKN